MPSWAEIIEGARVTLNTQVVPVLAPRSIPMPPTTPTPSRLKHLAFRRTRSYTTADIELDAGLNVFVGESDSGKTNIVRNLRTLVDNAPLETLRTVGSPPKSSAVLTLNDGGGFTFVLERSESKNDASVGTQVWSSVGGSTPEEYRRLLGLSPIDLSGVEADVHFSEQRKPLFVVDHPPSAVAKIVGAVSGLDVLYRAVAAGESERREQAAAVRAAENNLKQATADLSAADAVVERMRPLAQAVKDADLRLTLAADHHNQLLAARTEYAAARDRAYRLKQAGADLAAAVAAIGTAVDDALPLVAARDAFAAALSDLTQAEDHHDKALASAQAALAAAQEVARLYAAVVLPCPSCGTPVTAANLADHAAGHAHPTQPAARR